MARETRITLPQATRLGKITSYDELHPLLVQAETRGRLWVFKAAADPSRVGRCPTDTDIYNLHREMFEPLYSWAGQPRLKDHGPGGTVHVPWRDVRLQLRQRFDNLPVRLEGLETIEPNGLDTLAIAEVMAQQHHDCQYVHPFADTNGRTGRVLDHYFLWVTFRLAGPTLATSPFIEHFPSQGYEDEYYEGLQEADAGYPDRLVRYYADRIEQAVTAVEASLETGENESP